MVERAVLHHQHDDVLDLPELVESVVVRHAAHAIGGAPLRATVWAD